MTISEAIRDLDEAAESIIEHDSHGWAELPASQRTALYRQLQEIQRKLALADAPFFRAHEKDMPLSSQRQISYLKRVFAMPHREAKARLESFHRLDHEPDNRDDNADQAPKPEYMPHVREAVRAGTLGYDAVATVDRAIRALPSSAQDRVTSECDDTIAEIAKSNGPDAMGQISTYLRDLVGADDPYTHEDRQRKRSFTLSPQAEDGMSSFRGLATPEFAAGLQRLFADYAKPGDLQGGAAEGDGPEASSAGDPLADERTPEQRRHDALEACLFAGFARKDSSAKDRASQPLRPRRGTTTIAATARLEDVLTQRGKAITDTGTHLDVEGLIARTDCTDFYVQLLDLRGATLYLGRSTRLASMEQYLALVGEELLSSAPGSSAMAAYCHIHHVDGWKHGGETNLDNLTFASPYHHGTVDDDRSNPNRWHTERPGPGSDDRVLWIPPEHVDPDRVPRSNKHPTSQLSGRARARTGGVGGSSG